MSDLKHQMVKHIRSARKWLEQAENAYDGEKKVRGQLNLMLAEAEMKHAREKVEHKRRTKRIFIQLAAPTAAVLIVAAGLTFVRSPLFYPAEKQAGEVLPTAPSIQVQQTAVQHQPLQSTEAVAAKLVVNSAAKQATQVVEQAKEVAKPVITTIEKKASVEARPAAVESPGVIDETPVKAAVTTVSNDELKKLIRTAERTLRTQ